MHVQQNILMVIHDEVGSLKVPEKVLERIKQKGCEWAPLCGELLGERGQRYCLLPYNRPEIRKDPRFVSAVKELAHEADTLLNTQPSIAWQEWSRIRWSYVGDLRVVRVTVRINIKETLGKESLEVSGYYE